MFFCTHLHHSLYLSVDDTEGTALSAAPYTIRLRHLAPAVWFQQVGGTAHTERISREVPHRFFLEYADIKRPIFLRRI